MRIDIDINDQYPDTSVTIHAPRLSQDIEKMIANEEFVYTVGKRFETFKNQIGK